MHRRLLLTPEAFSADALAASRFFQAGQALVDRLPSRAARTAGEQAAVEALSKQLREVRIRFLRSYAPLLYAELTSDRRAFVRIEDLVYMAAERVPGLVPTRATILAERARLQKDKDGHEVDQGLFLSQVLSHPLSGAHLVHAMLRPRRASRTNTWSSSRRPAAWSLARSPSNAGDRSATCITATRGS